MSALLTPDRIGAVETELETAFCALVLHGPGCVFVGLRVEAEGVCGGRGGWGLVGFAGHFEGGDSEVAKICGATLWLCAMSFGLSRVGESDVVICLR